MNTGTKCTHHQNESDTASNRGKRTRNHHVNVVTLDQFFNHPLDWKHHHSG
jgi:hypothetical protein